MFIWAIIFTILAVILTGVAFTVGRGPRNGLLLGSGVSIFLAVLFFIFSMSFTVDTGSTKVLKDWTGVVAEDPITTPGIHFKAPWQDDISWDIRNQDVTFTGDGTTSHDGQEVTGAEIVFIDKDGISAMLDLQVLFSIKADKTVDLTRGYANQTDFTIKVVENDVKSTPRDVASAFTTVQMFEERARLKVEITKQLEELWADKGIIVENVNIHGIRYPEDVQQRFKDAQNAQTDLLKAETDAKTAQTKAEGEAAAAIAKATGEAEANRILAASLTPEVLKQRWIDAIKGSGTIIVPQDFTSLGNLTPQG